MLAVRSSHPAFGRGTLTLLSPKNRKVLAYLREYEGDTLLCVANLGHSPEAVELDLSQFADRVPVELNAGSLFPPIGELTYLLTLPPFGFYWFVLAAANDPPSWHTPAPEPLPEFVTMIVRDSLAKALASPAAKLVEDEALPQYIAKRRWFGLKDQTIKAVRVTDLVNIGDSAHRGRGQDNWSDDALASAVGGSLGGRTVYSAPQYARSGARAAWPAHGFAH